MMLRNSILFPKKGEEFDKLLKDEQLYAKKKKKKATKKTTNPLRGVKKMLLSQGISTEESKIPYVYMEDLIGEDESRGATSISSGESYEYTKKNHDLLMSYREKDENGVKNLQNGTEDWNLQNDTEDWNLSTLINQYNQDAAIHYEKSKTKMVFVGNVTLQLPKHCTVKEEEMLPKIMFARRNGIQIYDTDNLKSLLTAYISIKNVVFFNTFL